MPSRSVKSGLLPLLATAFIWGWPNILIKLISHDFDALTQSFFRYLAASTTTAVLCLIFWRRTYCDGWRNLRHLLLPATVVTVHQMTYVTGVYLTSAIAASVISKTSALFVPALSFLFFPEERAIIRNPRFLAGTALALSGVVGLVVARGGMMMGAHAAGPALLLLSALLWSLFSVLIKPVTGRVDPLVITGIVPLLSCLLFLPLWASLADLGQVFTAPLRSVLIMLGSGILVVGVGNTLYYIAIQRVGTSISTNFLLSTPLVAGVLAYAILGERLTPLQMVFSAVLLTGCLLISRSAMNEKAVRDRQSAVGGR
jgi:drug/metabolite transporter (DMT)-like permease